MIAPTIRKIQLGDAAAFHDALDSVAKERKFLLTVEAPSIERVKGFIQNNLEKGYPQVVAVQDQKIVGWADFVSDERESLRHTANLGMGVIKEFRRQGIGRALLQRVFEDAVASGFVRLELEVFSNNRGAIELYENFGFSLEGIKVKARKIDGEFHDAHVMAKIATISQGSEGASRRDAVTGAPA